VPASGFEDGIQAAIEAMLVSPEFLFDRARSGDRRHRHAASRQRRRARFAPVLSLVEHHSDAELLGLAERGRLKDPAVLEHQVRRMLDDPRADTLVSNFAGQWLQLRNVETVNRIR